jgi:hypothetical protein
MREWSLSALLQLPASAVRNRSFDSVQFANEQVFRIDSSRACHDGLS